MAERKKGVLRSFPGMFWLVILFEFFERGSYYGVMSILSVYLTDRLGFPKENVGLIKGTIQPLLYFLPIVTGALADRFGYRKVLLAAFTLLGTGYLLTSQATAYTAVFLALCVMGLGAGAFKPIVSGTIARVTDESNSTVGFGIYYWSINLGAFLFPLILVPLLKSTVGWSWVIVAAAVGTGAMILPTLLFYREPPADPSVARKDANLVQTLADAFEIIYSPVILAVRRAASSPAVRAAVVAAGIVLAALGAWRYLAPGEAVMAAPGTAFAGEGGPYEVRVVRDMTAEAPWTVESAGDPAHPVLTVHDPDRTLAAAPEVLAALGGAPGTPEALERAVRTAEQPPRIRLVLDPGAGSPSVEPGEGGETVVRVPPRAEAAGALAALRAVPELAFLPDRTVGELLSRASRRPFLLGFVALVLWAAALAVVLQPRYRDAAPGTRRTMVLGTVGVGLALLWLLPGLSGFARIVSSVIYLTVSAIFLMDLEDLDRFRDHWRFLLLIFLYSGFWVLYFQMFDSVLWYVKAYVDASSLDHAVNGLLASLGIGISWRFDVEHVTVINAGTIILLQLVVSSIVRKTRALPTMIAGILMGTVGMAILAVSTSIWVFIAGIVIFSIGEMTAHPKFISYVGLIAPRDRVATYMGYIFLYGVIGSSIGGVLGANLYVHYVDRLNQPRTLWLIFSMIGVATIAGLLLYSRLVHREAAPEAEGA